MNVKQAQKTIALIIYSVAHSPPKYIWFKILRLAGLEYHFSDQLVKNQSDTLISIGACRAGNYKLFMNYMNTALKQNYHRIACKYNYKKIQNLYAQDTFPKKINNICRYSKNIEQFNVSLSEKELIALGKNGDITIIKYVIHYEEKNFGQADYESLMEGACRKGNLELIKFLLQDATRTYLELHIRNYIEGIIEISKKKKKWHIYDYVISL